MLMPHLQYRVCLPTVTAYDLIYNPEKQFLRQSKVLPRFMVYQAENREIWNK
jgi:hypothetical protein